MAIPDTLTITTTGVTGGFGGPCLLMMPHALTSRPQALLQRGDVIEVPSGARMTDKAPATAQARHEFQFVCGTHAERATLVEFFETMQGMGTPFWFPTWQWELDVCGFSLFGGGGSLWLKRWADQGYADGFYPKSTAFRKLIMLYDDAYIVQTIVSAAANDSPGVDLMGLNTNDASGVVPSMGDGPSQHNERFRPLWLRWGKFDQDELVEESLNQADGICSIRLAMLELPDEVVS